MSQFIEMFGACKKHVSLSSLCNVFQYGDWIESKDQSETGIRLIQTGNVGNGIFKDKGEKARYISEETFNRFNCTEIFEGDILVSRLPDPVGRACVMPIGLGKCITAVDCTIIRLGDKILPEYLLWFTRTPDYSMQIKKVLSGTTRLRVSRANLGNIQIPLPDIEQQSEFCKIAHQADKSEFVGFKSQFIEMFGNPVANNKGWSTMALKQVAPEEPSRERQTGTVWILNLDMIESHTGKIIDKVYDEDTNLLSVAPFDEGNVLYSKLRPYLNKVVIPKGKGYATTELVPLRPNQEYLNLTFFSHLLRGDDFVTYANTISSGTKMPRMPLNDLRNFQCILPPMEEQLKFEKVAEQTDKSLFLDEIDYLLPEVKIEVGARSLIEPTEEVFVQSMIEESFPTITTTFQNVKIRTAVAEKTFLEKSFLLHELFSNKNDVDAKRRSRHIYDLYMMTQKGFAYQAVKNDELWNTIHHHRATLTSLSGVDYTPDIRDRIQLVPPTESLKNWELDYKKMTETMIYGKVPTFSELIDCMHKLEMMFKNRK